jgi:hypothetical protein
VRKKIKYYSIPVHCGVEVNERAGSEAKKSIKEGTDSQFRMRAGHTSLKANLNRFNSLSMAECECGDGLQTEDHIFWGCKLYEEQRATMMDILSDPA